MASVLLCEDERLQRQVAVKRLHADSPDDVEQRFVREAQLGASLNHPNLVSVFDTATDDEGVLIVMEYVEGEALARALRRGPLEPGAGRADGCDLGAALDHAHAQGVVHRDVKPGNVLLRHDGVTKLVDLGIATAAGPDPHHAQRQGARHGRLHGARAARGRRAATGDRRVRAGRRSASRRSRASGRAAAARRRDRAPDRDGAPAGPARRTCRPRPAAAADALKRAMAREPGERPASAGELASGLAAALDGREPPRPVAAAPTRRLHGPHRARCGRRRPRTVPASTRPGPADRHAAGPPAARRSAALIPVVLLAVVAAAVAVLLLSGGGGSGGESEEPRQQARDRPPAAQAERPKPKDESPKAADKSGGEGAGPTRRPGADRARTHHRSGERRPAQRRGLRADAAGRLRGGRPDPAGGGRRVARGQPRHQLRLRALQPGQVAQPLGPFPTRRSRTSRSA